MEDEIPFECKYCGFNGEVSKDCSYCPYCGEETTIPKRLILRKLDGNKIKKEKTKK